MSSSTRIVNAPATGRSTQLVLPILHSNCTISRVPAQTGTPRANTSPGESLARHPSSVALLILEDVLLPGRDVPLDLPLVAFVQVWEQRISDEENRPYDSPSLLNDRA